MTINIFLAIFASVLFLTGAIGCFIADSENEEGICFIGVIFGICSIVVFGLAFTASSNYELQFYHWLIFIFPLVYIIILIWKFFTKDYIFYWKELEYCIKYRDLRKEFDSLQDDYNKLDINFHRLESTYQEELQKILKKQSTEINNNNSKLYF